MINGRSTAGGFYAVRSVGASTEDAAVAAAIELVKNDGDLLGALAESIGETAEFGAEIEAEVGALLSERENQGFIFFEDETHD